MFAVISGLNQSSVSRLKQTWKVPFRVCSVCRIVLMGIDQRVCKRKAHLHLQSCPKLQTQNITSKRIEISKLQRLFPSYLTLVLIASPIFFFFFLGHTTMHSPLTSEGLYLRDLTFIEDGNPDICENGMINFEKMRMIAKGTHYSGS